MINLMRAIKHLSIHVIGFIFLFPTMPATLQATQVLNYDKDGYSITVPTGWIAIPSYMVTSAMRVTQQFAPTIPTQHYQRGLQLNTATGWFNYPYVLIGTKHLKPISTTDLEQIINLEQSKKIDKVKGILKPLIGNMKVSGINYEPSSHIIWLRMLDTDPVKNEEISSICGVILTKQGAIQVIGFTKRSEFENYFPLFEQVIRSVKATQPIAYPATAEEHTFPYSYKYFIIAGVLISLVFILLFFFLTRAFRKFPVVEDVPISPTLQAQEEKPSLTDSTLEPLQKIEEIPTTQETTAYPLILPKIQNYYDILGIDRQAEEAEIKRAAQAKLKEVRAELEALGAHERSVYGKIAKSKGERIKKAFHTLSDAERRKKYDESLT